MQYSPNPKGCQRAVLNYAQRLNRAILHRNHAQIAEGLGAVGHHRQKNQAKMRPALQEAQQLNADGKTVFDRCAYQHGEQTIAVLIPVENTRHKPKNHAQRTWFFSQERYASVSCIPLLYITISLCYFMRNPGQVHITNT